ncbi:hypothetical protein [Sphingopyxis sp. JAI128]|uniref:hypothetical protein n=1 Tax=Sphingopyxis sp. JAI128 TaxID=2723066 RepID=UPI00160ACD01|nr:hypothetical protein [Sphingopyxis sp. JAI128]MBB6424948.1 hypothetical protein [Sphingopyxis sp. JAI128]
MANRMGPNDWRSASPVNDDGHVAWVQRVEVSGSTGTSTVEGEGTAGTPAGGVLTVQGDPSGTPIPVVMGRPDTGTVSSVPSGTASVGILSANPNRLGATITNTDANTLRLLLSTGTASATNFTVAIQSDGYYEVPFGYTGDIVGIWDADGSGAALVTEFG